MNKLNRIRLENVSYDGLPLSEVVRNLSEQARLRDPDKKGINFLINPNPDTSGRCHRPPAGGGGSPFGGAGGVPPEVGGGGAQQINPATGLPVASAPAAGAEPVESTR